MKIMVNYAIQLKAGIPALYSNSFYFDFAAILNWIFWNQLYFHLVMIIMHQLTWLVPSIAEVPSNPLLNLSLTVFTRRQSAYFEF